MIEFYNVKKKCKVQIDDEKVTKKAFEQTLKSGAKKIRYAFQSVDDDGTKLTKFCSKAQYDALS